MERKIPVNKTISYTTIQDYFLAHWVSIIGLGPTVLYLQLLSYCHKGKDIAWPSIQTLNKRMCTTTKTLIRYRNTLIEYGLIKKIVKQISSSGGYDHNLYQMVLLDKEHILYPPAEKLPEENEEIISGISEESPSSNQDNHKKIVTDNKKSLKTERIKEGLEKLDLLEIKRNVVNPAGWLIAALQVNYLNTESSKEENYEEEKIMEAEEGQPESKTIKPEKILPQKKEKEETKRLSREEELEWIRTIRNTVLK